MKLALYQGASPAGETEAAFATIGSSLRAAATAGAGMLVFPELFLPGYNQPALHRSLAQPRGGPWETHFAALARHAGCGLTIGWAERDGEILYNAASSFDGQGNRIGHYRKIQLYGPMENAVFIPGDDYCIFDFAGYRTALLICYDVEFAGHCRALKDLGAELLLVPTANPAGFEHVSDILLPARAAEMNLTIAYANYCGPEDRREDDADSENRLSFGGGSLLLGPDARMLAKAGNRETLLIADLGGPAPIDPYRVSTQQQDYRPQEPREAPRPS
jgi:nitrilase